MTEQLAKRLDGFDQPTVWHEFTSLALEHKAINLGQGFPDWQCEDFVKKAAKDALDADFNQYARPQGHKKLVQVLAKQYSKELKHEINWTNEVAVGVGATETIYAAINSYVEPEDEVVVFEPAFDIYSAQVQMAGGKCRFVPLSVRVSEQSGAKEFYVDEPTLAAAFSSKTRAVLLNNPHNPTGKAFTEEELELKHVRIANMDGMWERTLTVSSAGKTFSVTGWKVGWAIGPSNLIKGACLANNWIQFSVATPLQEAVASMLDLAEKPYKEYPTFYAFVADQYKQKRDRLTCSLVDVGIVPITPGGGIFLYSDISAIKVPDSFIQPNMTHDWAFCRWLTITKGVTAIPTTAFFCNENKTDGSQWARFAFCKTDEAINEAIKRLAKLRDS
ncbi:unnamed protein product [Peronospora destructor]|uniref:Aminotransferase class I/classII large domain-containing protein n=1 Tax=Peronospora destructor TaxID=86335 RepID=A0AAV0TC37_9STRA|nr:unnamed protein product [Peronospora destructor]